jgi:hypothetical protein
MQHLIEAFRKSISLLFQCYVLRSRKLQGYLISLLKVPNTYYIAFYFNFIMDFLIIKLTRCTNFSNLFLE